MSSAARVLATLDNASELLTAKQIADKILVSERQTLTLLTELMDKGDVEREYQPLGTGGKVSVWRRRIDPFQALAAAFGGYSYTTINVKDTR